MEFGDCELLREKSGVRILKNGCRNGKVSYCVIGLGPTKFYDDYDDALEEFNYRWVSKEYN